jgi:hypothetical protein
VNKRFRVCSHDQPFLLPPSLQDWLPENHLARFIADVMNELDLSSIYGTYERSDGRGLNRCLGWWRTLPKVEVAPLRGVFLSARAHGATYGNAGRPYRRRSPRALQYVAFRTTAYLFCSVRLSRNTSSRGLQSESTPPVAQHIPSPRVNM